jgi:branched-chain amino acid aminotransferase
VDEIIQAFRDGKLQEAFGTGTAANIAPISVIGHEDEDFTVPPATPETFAMRALGFLNDVKAGRIDDPFNWIMK